MPLLKNWLTAVWRDPVWSKLIAVGLLAIIGLLWNFIANPRSAEEKFVPGNTYNAAHYIRDLSPIKSKPDPSQNPGTDIKKEDSISTVQKDNVIKPKVTEKPKPPQPEFEEILPVETCEINNRTYRSITMSSVYFIKFYDKKGNRYRFIAHESAEDMNGTAILSGNKITLIGNFGNSEVELSDECNYLTGYIKGNYGTYSMNYSK